MKDKPTSHKSQNCFKFESFKDRLAKVNVSLFHHRKAFSDEDEDISNFLQTLQKWQDLNCTEHFEELSKAIGKPSTVQNLAQILLRKNEIIHILIENLNKEDNKAIEVVLELIVALARDLQHEFYPHLSDFLDHLFQLLQAQDSELIENTFVCLAFLFKFLWRYIVNDFDRIYQTYSNRMLVSSQKAYIRQFASEAFSFLIRKVTDKEAVFQLIFESVEQNGQISEGVGYLLFEAIRGVKNQFHKDAESFLKLMLKQFAQRKCLNSNAKDALEVMFKKVAFSIPKEYLEIAWKIIFWDGDINEIEKVLNFFEVFIHFGNGKLILEPEKVISYLTVLLDYDFKQETRIRIVKMISTVILSQTAIDSENLILKSIIVYSNSKSSVKEVFEFSKSLFNFKLFEKCFLPKLLDYCQHVESDEIENCINFLAELILFKVPRPISGDDFEKFSTYLLKLNESKKNEAFVKKISNYLINSSDLAFKRCCLLCLANFNYEDSNEICDKIVNEIKNLDMKSFTEFEQRFLAESFIVEAVLSLILLNQNSLINHLLPETCVVNLLKSNPLSGGFLKVFDFYFTHAKMNGFTSCLQLEYLEQVYLDCLEPNLASFFRINRLLVCHILTLFDPPLRPVDDPNLTRNSIFAICLKAEKINSTTYNYREKLNLLQRLDFSVVQNDVPLPGVSGVKYDLMPLHFLLGALYENFSLLWKPIQKLIETYARGFNDSKNFFTIIFNHIQLTRNYIYDKDIEHYFKLYEEANHLKSRVNERPDHANYRLNLLSALGFFIDALEPRNRGFVTLFFDFLENEIFKFNLIHEKSTQDISCLKREENEIDENAIENEDDEMKFRPHHSLLWKTMFSFLEIFSKFKNPRKIFRAPELHELYLNLLKSNITNAQKLAFQCLLTYDYQFLKNYQEYFIKIIDDQTFKSEILKFSMSSENEEDNILKQEHRSEVIPIMMRIVYGKMLSSFGAKIKGKHYTEKRRALLLRILSGCQTEELLIFMNLSFAPISHILSKDYIDLQNYIKNFIDIKKFFPLPQLQALINTLNSMIDYFTNHSNQINSYLFKVLIILSSVFNYVLTVYREEVKKTVLFRIKAMRNLANKIAIKIFEKFSSNYSFSSYEVESLFVCLVWPLLKNLDNESLSCPSPLLKLFYCWSKNQRYFQFLTVKDPSQGYSPVDLIGRLYVNPKANQKVTELISNLWNNLLDGGEIKDNEEEEESTSKNDDDLGTSLVNSRISDILLFLRNKFDRKIKTSKEIFSLIELNILSRICSLVTDPSESAILFKLLTTSINSRQSENSELRTLQSMNGLTKNISPSEGSKILKTIAQLFESIYHRQSRLELCAILTNICQNKELSKIVDLINSYSSKMPEEPNYNFRLDGFKLIKDYLERNQIDLEFSSTILFNCCFFINSFPEDMTIRESSSRTIVYLIEKLAKVKNEVLFNEIVIKQLLYSQIRNSIRCKNDSVHYEFIGILKSLISNCHKRHHIFNQLYLISSDDQELDFWENIRHIQIHRRSRALMKLANDKKLMSSLSLPVLTSIFLPLTNKFLNDERFQKDTLLINNLCSAVGSFCSYLPWEKYEAILKFYLKMLSKKSDHKIIVQVITSILDNFHFDLSEAVGKTTQGISVEKADLKKNSKVATKIFDNVTTLLLPQLHNCLNQKSKIDFSYSSRKTNFTEEDEIKRIPLSLAMVKLMKCLPQKFRILESNISNILLRLCQFLQSRSEGVREATRSMLCKIMNCLGPRFFPYVLKELRTTLTKGYQLHILIYTVHSLMLSMNSVLKAGDLDCCLTALTETFNLELFTKLSEEKEVKQITAKLKEARKCKSYDAYKILATFISGSSLVNLLHPIREILQNAHDQVFIKRASSCLSKISVGLLANKGICEKTLLIFIFGILNNTLPKINKKEEVKKEKKTKERPDSFLLPKQKKKVKINTSTNDHILTELGLQLLHSLLKRNRLQADSQEHLSLLDPFVELLDKFLDCKYSKLTILSLKSLSFLITKFPSLPALKSTSANIIKKTFFLINKFSGARHKRGENSLIVAMSFKVVTVLIQNIEVDLKDDDLKVLLTYIENDLYDDHKQTMAFALLKSILTKKFEAPELEGIMNKVAAISIQSLTDHIREKSRRLWIRYLVDYQHGVKLKSHILFFIRHLEYEHESGRQSAVEFINLVVSSLSYSFLHSHIDLIFVPLASRLINEDSSACKKLVAHTITRLLFSLQHDDRTNIFKNYLLAWFQHKNAFQRQLAAQLCSIFVEVEKENFVNQRISFCLPLIRQQLDPDRYLENSKSKTSQNSDHLIYHLINIIVKLLKIFPDLIKSDQYFDDINIILEHLQNYYLLYPHSWVRLISLQLFGLIFSNYSVETLAQAIANSLQEKEYFLNDTEQKLVKLSSNFGLLLRDIYENESHADQIIKNLLYVAKVCLLLPKGLVEDPLKKGLNLRWLMKILVKEVKFEVSNSPNNIKKRIWVFKWIAAICLELGKERLEEYLLIFLGPICREFSMKSRKAQDDQLALLCKQVFDIIKDMIGSEKFTIYYNDARNELSSKRMERKKKRALQKVSDPVTTARKKIKKRLKEKEQKKKRKLKHQNFGSVKKRRVC